MGLAAVLAVSSEPTELPEYVHNNIQSVAQIASRARDAVRPGQRAIEVATRLLVRPWMVGALAVCVLSWIVVNLAVRSTGQTPVDPPPFFWLQGVIALYAAFVSTMVLVTQRREERESKLRAHLEFHVNLLAEQKATKIIALLEELRRDMPGVRDRDDPIADALQEEVDPQVVHSAIAHKTEP